jgi:hypothetical protein
VKGKCIVTSMVVAGLISSPLLANTKENNEIPTAGYKGELFAAPCPNVTMYSPVMDAMSQNVRRAKPTVGCGKPVQFAGGVNFDTQFGNLNQGFMGENNSRITLNDAYLDVTGNINPWVTTFMELSYNNIQNTALNNVNYGQFRFDNNTVSMPGLYSEAYSLNAVNLQQGYITIGNPERFPLFLKLGKQFQDFGRYTIHPITRSMTQVMTETLQTSAELSFISAWHNASFHGSIFGFQNQIPEADFDGIVLLPGHVASNHGDTNFGAQLGVGQVSTQLGWDIGVGYINDMMGVNDIAYATAFLKNNLYYGSTQVGQTINTNHSFYVNQISGLTAYGMVNSGPFSLNAHYVTALQSFSSLDLTSSLNRNDEDFLDGAQPWAADLQVAYGFNYWERSQNLYVGYQQSGEAVALFIPERRWVAGYGIEVLKNTNLGLEYSNDQAYSVSNGGNNENSNRVAVRVGVILG